ncbi:cytochrome P450 [Leptodontidium sp. 2 PMI_412]|nr:cytochrome P450 [Leptodontidium sp. 2 PMI_412]
MTNLLDLEPAIDSCSILFMKKLHEFAIAGKSVDLGSWLQYYAFDVIHPSIGLLLERHVPKGGATISGAFIPAGTIVEELVFPDPESFIPERWIDSSVERLREMERSFFAFGAGSRTCTGRNVSLLEMVKVLPCLVREFDVKLVESVGEGGGRGGGNGR